MPKHSHNMMFPSPKIIPLDTSEPINIGDIRWGRYSNHTGTVGKVIGPGYCRTDGYGTKLLGPKR